METDSKINLFGRKFSRWAIPLAFLVIGILVYSPYLNIGFSSDDFIFLNMLEGALPYDPVKGFWHGDMDSFPGFEMLWWREPGVSGAFLRPIPSWLITAHFKLFARNSFPYHLTSIIIHSMVAYSAYLVLRRLSRRESLSILAAFMFLICDDHGMTIAWITTVTDLTCVLFLNLAFTYHLMARQNGKPRMRVISILFFLMAMLSKETAAIFPAIIVLYEFIFVDVIDDRASPLSIRDRTMCLLRNWPAWLIPAVVFVGYMLFYRSIVPPMRSLMYGDPLSQPVRYISMMLTNLPVMFVGLLSQFLPSIVMMIPETLPYVVGFGIILILFLLWALLPYRQERAIWFAFFVFVLGLLPGLAAEAGERLLYFPSVYGLFVLAWLVAQIPRLRMALSPDSPPGIRILGPIWGWYLLISSVLLPFILLFIYPWMWIPGLQSPEKAMLNSLPYIEATTHEHVVYLNTDSSFNTFYLPDLYRYHRGEFTDLRVLSSFNGRMWARLEDTRSIVLRTDDQGWLNNMFARIVRLSPTFRVGDTYTTDLFTATILAVTSDEQDITQVRFDFTISMDDPSLLILYYDGDGYNTWKPSDDWQLLNAELDPFAF